MNERAQKKPKTCVLDFIFFFFGISICQYIDIPMFKPQLQQRVPQQELRR